MMNKIAVIGSNSFSGGCFIDFLLSDSGNEVIGMSRSPEKSDLFLPYKGKGDRNFKFYQCDLNRDFLRLQEILTAFQPSYIVNFAAQGEVGTSWQYPEDWFQTNAVSMVKLGNFLKDLPSLKQYVHISTPEVYGSCGQPVDESQPLNPTTPYAASKAASDLFLFTLVKRYQFPLVMIRSTNVFGKHQQLYRIIPRTIIFLKKGLRIPLQGGGRAIKAYLHIHDVSRGIVLAMAKGEPGSIYHFSPSTDISIRDLVKNICEMMECSFDSVTEEVPDRPGQDARYLINSSKARQELLWKPQISLREGIQEMIGWIENNWNQIQKEELSYVHIRS